MIKQISIHALKSIKNITLNCSNLNLLAGVNSSGKSTVIQALLLSKQAFAFREGLRGRLISLGDFGEVRNYELRDDPIRIELEDSLNTKYTTEFSLNEQQAFTISKYVNGDENKDFSLFDRFYYLSCHRIGALDIYEKPHGDSRDCGIEGEFALGVLLQHDEYCLPDTLTVQDDKHINTLSDQVNYWLEKIVNTVVTSKDISRSNYTQVLYNNNPKYMGLERFHNRPVNIGSGISYLISIIITCLMSEEDSIICIENPEIHLHPKAQSELTKFLYFIAASGRQIFVETHSDHVFNGLRVGISNKTMDAEKVAIDFLALNKETFETQCNPVQINKYGDLQGLNDQMTLEDFFDQYLIDLNAMLGL